MKKALTLACSLLFLCAAAKLNNTYPLHFNPGTPALLFAKSGNGLAPVSYGSDAPVAARTNYFILTRHDGGVVFNRRIYPTLSPNKSFIKTGSSVSTPLSLHDIRLTLVNNHVTELNMEVPTPAGQLVLSLLVSTGNSTILINKNGGLALGKYLVKLTTASGSVLTTQKLFTTR